MRQGPARLDQRRPEADEAVVLAVERVRPGEQARRVRRQFAGEHRDIRPAVEGLAAGRLAAAGRAPAGLVLIAPAADFTERLMWASFPEDVRREIMETGAWLRPSAYSPEPYPITRALIEEGRRHLILDKTIRVGCPIHVLQGMADPDVPWQHAMTLVEHLAGDDVVATLIKDGDHRLSRRQDLDKLVEAIEGVAPAMS